MVRFLSTSGVFSANGEYDFTSHGPNVSVNSRLILPNGATLPAITYANGEVFYIPASGVLCITNNSIWRIKSVN